MHRKAAVCERKIKWQRQNKTELLAENQIHLWLIPLNELPITFSEGFCEGLTERERSRAEKIGMGRFITNLSQEYGFLYGLIAVFISVFLGWSAGYLFRKM